MHRIHHICTAAAADIQKSFLFACSKQGFGRGQQAARCANNRVFSRSDDSAPYLTAPADSLVFSDTPEFVVVASSLS